jgi:hypothetical protein
MPYLYRHIRLDKNEPFYIGIGSDKLYKRAYDKKSRNKHWNFVINKTSYEVDILMDGLTWEQACEKEKEFIKLYGRKDLNEGILVNMTDGGDGVLGSTMPEASKKLMIDKISITVMQYDIKGSFIKEWRSISEAGKTLNINISAITKCCKGVKNRKSVGGFVWRYKDTSKWFNPEYTCYTGISELNRLQRGRKKKPVTQMSLNGDVIKEWESPTDAAKFYNTTSENIYRSIKYNLTAVGFVWKYKNNQ